MARKRREPYPATSGSLALDRSYERDYRQAAERYIARDAAVRETPKVKRKPRTRLCVIALVLLFFVSAFALLFRQAGIEQQILKLHKMKSELKTQEELGEALRLELSLGVDIDNVQRTAKEEMDMSYPEAGMTREIVLPPIMTMAELESANTVLQEDERDAVSSWIDDIRQTLMP